MIKDVFKLKKSLDKKEYLNVLKYNIYIKPLAWFTKNVKARLAYPIYYLYKTDIVKNLYYNYLRNNYLVCSSTKDFYTFIDSALTSNTTDKKHIIQSIKDSMYNWHYKLWLYGDRENPLDACCGVPSNYKPYIKNRFKRAYSYNIKMTPAYYKTIIDYTTPVIKETYIITTKDGAIVKYLDSEGKTYITTCYKDGSVDGYVPLDIYSINTNSLDAQLGKFRLIPKVMLSRYNKQKQYRHEIF